MSARSWPFKLTNVRRLIQAANESKLKVYSVRCAPDGTITIDTQPIAPPAGQSVENSTGNPWDKVA
jgi:hypothetical protein